MTNLAVVAETKLALVRMAVIFVHFPRIVLPAHIGIIGVLVRMMKSVTHVLLSKPHPPYTPVLGKLSG